MEGNCPAAKALRRVASGPDQVGLAPRNLRAILGRIRSAKGASIPCDRISWLLSWNFRVPRDLDMVKGNTLWPRVLPAGMGPQPMRRIFPELLLNPVIGRLEQGAFGPALGVSVINS